MWRVLLAELVLEADAIVEEERLKEGGESAGGTGGDGSEESELAYGSEEMAGHGVGSEAGLLEEGQADARRVDEDGEDETSFRLAALHCQLHVTTSPSLRKPSRAQQALLFKLSLLLRYLPISRPVYRIR